MTTESRVWHHKPTKAVGREVVALYGQPCIGGWMPHLNSGHVAKKNDEGQWELNPDGMERRIGEIAAEVEAAGHLMLDCEGPLDSHENVPLYLKALSTARNVLFVRMLDPLIGYFRMPEHAVFNAANRFAMMPVLAHTTGAYIVIKGTGDYWVEYLRNVAQAAPNHRHVVYLDAYRRKTGEPFPPSEIIARVRFAYGWLRNPEIVFRQEGPHVATAMTSVRDWLGHGFGESPFMPNDDPDDPPGVMDDEDQMPS